MTWGQLGVGNYYYFKDLSHVYSTCRGLPYGKEDQTLFTDDELSKAFQNSKHINFFLESFRRHKLFNNKVKWLDLALWLWLALIGLPFTSTIQMHFQTIIKFLKPRLNSYSSHYSWFVQYMKSDKVDCRIFQIPLGMFYFQYFHSKKTFQILLSTLHVDKKFNYWVLFVVGSEYCLQTAWQCL